MGIIKDPGHRDRPGGIIWGITIYGSVKVSGVRPAAGRKSGQAIHKRNSEKANIE